MAEYLAPGVYVEEVDRGAKSIEGVGTSTAGFLGPTERGPVDPRLVTSFADFERVFGGFLEDHYLPSAVQGFFTNGGGRCFVGRVTSATTVATATLPGNGNNAVTDGNGSRDDETEDGNGDGENGTTNGDEENGTTNGEEGDGNGNGPVADGSGEGVITANAVGPGEWGSHVAVSVDDASMQDSDPDLFKLLVRYWSDAADVEATKQALEEAEENGDSGPGGPDVPAPDLEEVYDDLSPEKSASNYYAKQVNSGSVLVELERRQHGRPSNTDGDPLWLDGTFDDEGEVDVDHYTGAEPDGIDERTGLEAFEQFDEIAIVCVPDEHSSDDLTRSVVDHCNEMGDRFAILQSERDPDEIGQLRPPEAASDMAAFYYPWLEVRNPATGLTESMPPGGHIAGIYARSDTQHGVHKAPANEIVRGIQGLHRTITKGEQEILNPRGVNCIRSFRGRGIRVWGARTATSDPQWKYVNVRRLFLYLEESIDEGTQWVVFEPNDERLWARVKQTIRNFLTDVWQDGALMGSTPEEAFFVKCGRSTMTQNDIDNGRLICEIGVAPVKPAEFVVFRISQWTGGAE
jgi:phage tail sheath protein FI